MVSQKDFSNNTTFYIGTAVERAALGTSDITAFSVFFEAITRKVFIFTTEWVEV